MRSLPAARSAGPPRPRPPRAQASTFSRSRSSIFWVRAASVPSICFSHWKRTGTEGTTVRTSASRGFCQGRARRGPPPTWDVWLRGGPRHTPGWPLKRRFCVCTGVSAVTAVWVTDAHACVCSCGQRGRACPGEPACTGAVGACGVGACAGVWRTRASVEGRSCGRLGRRGWALSVTEVPCPAPGWWLHARDLIWPGHPVEWAAPPHLAGEDMQAELSHLLKVTQVGERGF